MSATDTSPASTDSEAGNHHVLSVLVENRFGVLARVAGLFSRRGFNIFSLAVAPTEDDRFSRITIVVDGESAPIEQITKQLYKLINVLRIDELAPHESTARELLLATVEESAGSADLAAAVDGFGGAEVLEETSSRVIVSFSGAPERVDELESRLRPLGIVELQRTGRIALSRLG
jgi:acetolactate synthase-1/3 small subunit